ncbi:hypothetical protein ABC974_28830 [Sphingomonas oligophenolica]|uniref:Uncharacterized protein n=1 Tax=Sphingomonas oligophenolica TaxID=301154 RepID=A0ABU9YD59_9SPHN
MSVLARDVRVNTLALMAMALIPLAGLVGGRIDITRGLHHEAATATCL